MKRFINKLNQKPKNHLTSNLPNHSKLSDLNHILFLVLTLDGLTNLRVYNVFFNIKEENNQLELYTNSFQEISSTELKDELEE